MKHHQEHKSHKQRLFCCHLFHAGVGVKEGKTVKWLPGVYLFLLVEALFHEASPRTQKPQTKIVLLSFVSCGGGCKRRKNCEVVAWCLPVSVGRGVVP